MILERALRAAAIVIAILGLVDPVMTLPWRESPVVSVAIVDPDAREMSALPQGSLSARDARALAARVIAALDDEFEVREGLIAEAAAVVLVGDGRSPAPTSAAASLATALAIAVPSGEPVVSAVVPSPAANAARIVRIDAPKRVHVSELTPVTVQVEARGLAGRTSAVVAHAAGLEVARAKHTWIAGAGDGVQQAAINLAIPSLQVGPARLTISVIDDAENSANDTAAPSTPSTSSSSTSSSGVTADVAVDVHDRPIRVLFVNGRPSWATRFIERALDNDPRFEVSSATRVSRGVTATSASAPASLAASDPDNFHVIVLGAPELLTKAEADTLRAFVRVRGGLLIVAPDRMLDSSNPVLDLLPARKFTERLLDEPAALTPMFASELAIPDALLPGADTLLRFGGGPATTPTAASSASTSSASTSSAPASAASNAHASATPGSPVIVGSPLGEGYAIVSGALDAWRYRDRAQDGFDRFWRDAISARAAAVPEPVEITLDPVVAAPDTPITLQVRVRSSSAATATTAATATATVAARLTLTDSASSSRSASPSAASASSSASASVSAPAPEPASSSASTAPASVATPTPIRLWPDARPSAYHGAINAPSRDGVYAVSVQLDGQAAPSRAFFRVQHDARITRPAWSGLQAFVQARRGLLVTSDQLDRLIRHLRESVQPANTRHARHPLRSAWWILPFAACLGGEWLLRRRRGER